VHTAAPRAGMQLFPLRTAVIPHLFLREAAMRTKNRIPLVPAHERMAPFNHLAGTSGMMIGHANYTCFTALHGNLE